MIFCELLFKELYFLLTSDNTFFTHLPLSSIETQISSFFRLFYESRLTEAVKLMSFVEGKKDTRDCEKDQKKIHNFRICFAKGSGVKEWKGQSRQLPAIYFCRPCHQQSNAS